MRVNYSDTHFTCDPIVDGIIEESPKETNNGCFEDEKKHIDLDGLDLLPADEATSPLLLCHPLRQKERCRPRYVFWR